MSVDVPMTEYRVLLANALETIKELTIGQIRVPQQPIAILGLGCRLPGGCSDPEAFWEFLCSGGDGVVPVPGARWDASELFASEPTPGKSHVKEGGFLQEDISQFDARFFGISPREANEMDPQQRLLLEVCWEALERAGIAPDSIKGSRTGVFIGQINSEYGMLPRTQMFGNPYSITGSMSNITAGRLSYFFGIHGPSLSIDTACSSSLVAVHLACESLNRRECDLAIAGGVNLLLSPAGFAMLCSMGALSPDGRCRMFAAGGDGYGRGEGIGAVVLKRARDAQRDHNPVLAVIKGSGVNQDGSGSGLTVPNGQAQQALLRETLKQAGIQPAQISYFEAHGTGTSLGDPIEFDALCQVFGNDAARSSPLVVGSVKSNIGHLEGAAGIAGLIKLVLCLQHREIPPNLHCDPINPRIQLNQLPAVVPHMVTPWQNGPQPLAAAISSFGFSGTNANVIVAEAPPALAEAPEVSQERPLHILTLSGKSKDALKALADRYGQFLAGNDSHGLADICFTANTGRCHFTHRLAVVAGDRLTLRDRLAARTATLDLEEPKPGSSAPKIAFLANGIGDPKLAAHLFHTQPAFRKAVGACDDTLRKLTGNGIIERWIDGHNTDTEVDAFCLQYCQLQMWVAWGVRPRAILGARTGELISACAGSVMELQTALELLVAAPSTAVNKALRNAQIHIFSATTGRQAVRSDMRVANYWSRIATAGAVLGACLDALLSQGYDTFICLGAKSVGGETTNKLTAASVHYVPFLSHEPWIELASGVANLYEAGVEIDWTGFEQGYGRRRVVLPTYPFQRKRFWIESAPLAAVTGTSMVPAQVAAPLDGRLIFAPGKEKLIEFSLPLASVPDVRDIHGVLHVGYYLEMLSRGVQRLFHGSPFTVVRFVFLNILMLHESRDNVITLMFDQKSENELTFSVYYQSENGDVWTQHAQGVVQLLVSRPPTNHQHSSEPIIVRKQHLTGRQMGTGFYDNLASDRRLELGQGVRWIADLWTGDREALARMEMPSSIGTDGNFVVGVHPGVFDACAQLFHAALPVEVGSDMRFIVTSWADVEWMECTQPQELWCHVTIDRFDPDTSELHGGFELLNEEGNTVVRVENAVMKGISAAHDAAFRELAGSSSIQPSMASEQEILRQFRKTNAEGGVQVIEDYVKNCFASVLGMDPDELNIIEGLGELGMDSLSALSGKNRIETGLGIQIPLAVLIKGPSIRQLVAAILPMIITASEAYVESRSQNDLSSEAKNASPWIAFRKCNTAAKVKLFCLPHGGAGASVYREWQNILPSEIEVCPIQLPGREGRIQERGFEDIDASVDALCEALTPELDRPYAFYGHSGGGLVAYRLAFRLQEIHELKPYHLFIGGYSSPTVHPNPVIVQMQRLFIEAGFEDILAPDDLSTMSEVEVDKLVAILLAFIASIPRLRMSIDDAKILLPQGLADLNLVRSFAWDGKRFALPVTVFHGLRDDRVTEEEAMAWQAVTSGPFKCHLVSGDHVFLREEQDQRLVLRHIEQDLRGLWRAGQR